MFEFGILGIKKDAEFARFLGIKPQTLSSWYSRNTFDIELLYAKCEFISADWLLTGKGEMLKSYNNEQKVYKLLEDYNKLLKSKLPRDLIK